MPILFLSWNSSSLPCVYPVDVFIENNHSPSQASFCRAKWSSLSTFLLQHWLFPAAFCSGLGIDEHRDGAGCSQWDAPPSQGSVPCKCVSILPRSSVQSYWSHSLWFLYGHSRTNAHKHPVLDQCFAFPFLPTDKLPGAHRYSCCSFSTESQMTFYVWPISQPLILCNFSKNGSQLSVWCHWRH